jgi:hypothetical protein
MVSWAAEEGLTSIHLLHPVVPHSTNPARLRTNNRDMFFVMSIVSSEIE